MIHKKTIFISHPIAGDVSGNMSKVLAICEQVHREGHVPVVPYLVSLQYLNDIIQEDRQLGIDANLACFERRFIDEVWLFGNEISKGMRGEIILAREFNIPVIAKTEETKKELAEFLAHKN